MHCFVWSVENIFYFQELWMAIIMDCCSGLMSWSMGHPWLPPHFRPWNHRYDNKLPKLNFWLEIRGRAQVWVQDSFVPKVIFWITSWWRWRPLTLPIHGNLSVHDSATVSGININYLKLQFWILWMILNWYISGVGRPSCHPGGRCGDGQEQVIQLCSDR